MNAAMRFFQEASTHDEIDSRPAACRLIKRAAIAIVLVGAAAFVPALASASVPARRDAGESAAGWATARVADPGAGAVLLAGQTVEIRWSRPPAGTRELELLLVAGRLTLRLTTELDPGVTTYRWRVPNIPASRAVLQVRFNRGGGEEIAACGAPFHIVTLTSAPRARASFRGGEWWLEAGAGRGASPLTRSLEDVARAGFPAAFLLALAPEPRWDGRRPRLTGSGWRRPPSAGRLRLRTAPATLASGPAAPRQRE
jgi:hypothetical protein